MNFEKTDLFGKEAQTTAGRYGSAGTRGSCHTTESRFRPQSHSASRPRDQKKRRGLGARMRTSQVVRASLLNFHL